MPPPCWMMLVFDAAKLGKLVLKKSYSVLQDDFFNGNAYTDVERGERGSTEEHLTVTQFKVQREQERLTP